MPNFGATPTSTTTLQSNQFPVSAARVPNLDSAGSLTAVEGIAVNTDSYNFQTTAIRIGLRDGDDATQGTSTDSAGVNTVIGQLKQIRLNTASITIGSALPAGGNLIGVVAFGGTTTEYVPANNGVTVVKGSAGRLASVIVINTGPAQLNFYDNASQASGTPIGAVPANAAVGSVYSFNAPALNGIVANSVANCCSVTVCYY